MLILQRELNGILDLEVLPNDDLSSTRLSIVVTNMGPKYVKLGIVAPDNVVIDRREITVQKGNLDGFYIGKKQRSVR